MNLSKGQGELFNQKDHIGLKYTSSLNLTHELNTEQYQLEKIKFNKLFEQHIILYIKYDYDSMKFSYICKYCKQSWVNQ